MTDVPKKGTDKPKLSAFQMQIEEASSNLEKVKEPTAWNQSDLQKFIEESKKILERSAANKPKESRPEQEKLLNKLQKISEKKPAKLADEITSLKAKLASNAEDRHEKTKSIQLLVNSAALIKPHLSSKSNRLKIALEAVDKKINVTLSQSKLIAKDEKKLIRKIYDLEYGNYNKQCNLVKNELGKYNIHSENYRIVNNKLNELNIKINDLNTKYEKDTKYLNNLIKNIKSPESTLKATGNKEKDLNTAKTNIKDAIEVAYSHKTEGNYKGSGAIAIANIDSKLQDIQKQKDILKDKKSLEEIKKENPKLKDDIKVLKKQIRKSSGFKKEELITTLGYKTDVKTHEQTTIKDLEKKLSKNSGFDKIIDKMSSIKIEPIKVGNGKKPNPQKGQSH